METKPEKKKMYFDSDKWDDILIKIQDYYEVKRSDKQFLLLKEDLGRMLSDMAHKIIKHKKLCDPSDIFDVVNECICNCFHLLSKRKFNPKKGRSFSWLTRVIQNTAIWYHYRNNADIPFATFQDKSVIEESEENLILYLAEYYENCCYYPKDHIDEKTGQLKTSKNIIKKKELRLQPYYHLISHDFESIFIKELESRIIKKRIQKMSRSFDSSDKYDKYDKLVVRALKEYLETESQIDNVTVRRVKKFIVNFFIDHMKENRWRVKGKTYKNVERSDLITIVNNILESKVKPFLLKEPTISEIKKDWDGK